MVSLLMKGFLVGLMVSIPLGPIGVLCVQKTLNLGRKYGFASGLGVAAADTIFALVSGLGISIMIRRIVENHEYFQIFGGAIIILLGMNVFLSNPVRQIRLKAWKRDKLYQEFLTFFFLTISNPLAIFFFLAMVAGVNLTNAGTLDLISIIMVVSGVFAGSAFWWFTLTFIIGAFRHRFSLKTIWWMNKASGITIFFLGIAAVLSACIL
jgi:threonine/homoserine/homoserine lactone efflux protein